MAVVIILRDLNPFAAFKGKKVKNKKTIRNLTL